MSHEERRSTSSTSAVTGHAQTPTIGDGKGGSSGAPGAVTPPHQHVAMTLMPEIHRRPPAGWGSWELRALLTLAIHERGPITVARLVEIVESEPGLHLDRRTSKVVSDALRAEVAKGWVVRVRRGVYGPGRLSSASKWRLRARVERARLPVVRT